MKKQLMLKVRLAVEGVRNEVADEFKDKFQDYYNDYTPKIYQRTGKLGEAYVKGDVVTTGNSVSSSVALVPNMEYPNEGADPEATLINAALPGGYHGGYKGAPNGSPVFTNAMRDLKEEERDLWIRHLAMKVK